MPTRSKFALFHGFLNFSSKPPKFRSVGGGGLCILFEICEKRPFLKCMGKGGIGDHIFEYRLFGVSGFSGLRLLRTRVWTPTHRCSPGCSDILWSWRKVKGDKWMRFELLNPNIVVSCPNLTACLRNFAIFDFLHSGEPDAASCTRHHPGVQGSYWSRSSTYWGLEGTHVAHVFCTSNATNPRE